MFLPSLEALVAGDIAIPELDLTSQNWMVLKSWELGFRWLPFYSYKVPMRKLGVDIHAKMFTHSDITQKVKQQIEELSKSWARKEVCKDIYGSSLHLRLGIQAVLPKDYIAVIKCHDQGLERWLNG